MQRSGAGRGSVRAKASRPWVADAIGGDESSRRQSEAGRAWEHEVYGAAQLPESQLHQRGEKLSDAGVGRSENMV